MRIHISLDEDVVREIDRRAGAGNRSAFIVAAVTQVLEDAARWDLLWSAVGSLDEPHEWDADPAGWVDAQRSRDAARVG